MNLKTAIASLLVGTAAWSSGVEGFNVPSGAAVGSVRAVETNSAGSNSNSNSYSNLLAQIDDANPYAQNLKSKLSMVAGGAQAEEYYEGKFVDKYFKWAKDSWDEVVAMRMNSPSGSSTSSVPHVPLFCRIAGRVGDLSFPGGERPSLLLKSYGKISSGGKCSRENARPRCRRRRWPVMARSFHVVRYAEPRGSTPDHRHRLWLELDGVQKDECTH